MSDQTSRAGRSPRRESSLRLGVDRDAEKERRSQFTIGLPLGGEVKGFTAKLVASVLALVLVMAVFIPLKWALGIYAIEAYLERIQSDLSANEDTIFSYKYDFNVPNFDLETATLKQAGIGLPAVDFFAASPKEVRKYRSLFPDDEWRWLMRSRHRLKSAVRRVFYFSAAPDAEVTLSFELSCFAASAKSTEPIAFSVRVNNRKITPYNDWEGRADLGEALLENYDSVRTSSDHWLRKHTLSLDMFEPTVEGEVRQGSDLADAIAADIERCSFDAMIFVRDIPEEFRPKDIITWLKEQTRL